MASRDKYTFQYADPNPSKVSSLALAKITSDFITSYKSSPHYEDLLSGFLEGLMQSPQVTQAHLKALEAAMIERQNAIIAYNREHDKEYKKKKAFGGPVRNKLEEFSDEEDDAEEEDDEEAQARRAAEEERKKQEWLKEEERREQLEQQRLENEARLQEKMRQVDARATEEALRREGAVLLNSGMPQAKGGKAGGKGGKGGKGNQPQLSPEEMAKLQRDVQEVVKERARLKAVVDTSDDDLAAALAEAKKELAEAETKAKGLSSSPAVPSKPLDKGQITQLQQKLTKQSMERDRFAMQLKAMEESAQRAELTEVLKQRDELMILVEAAENESN